MNHVYAVANSVCLKQEPHKLTPTVVVRAESIDSLFIGENLDIATMADGVVISRPKNVFEALCSTVALYWVFDIAYAERQRKTLAFIAGHVCKLETVRASVAIQRRLNILYAL